MLVYYPTGRIKDNDSPCFDKISFQEKVRVLCDNIALTLLTGQVFDPIGTYFRRKARSTVIISWDPVAFFETRFQKEMSWAKSQRVSNKRTEPAVFVLSIVNPCHKNSCTVRKSIGTHTQLYSHPHLPPFPAPSAIAHTQCQIMIVWESCFDDYSLLFAGLYNP
jgi:hypothetical protein